MAPVPLGRSLRGNEGTEWAANPVYPTLNPKKRNDRITVVQVIA